MIQVSSAAVKWIDNLRFSAFVIPLFSRSIKIACIVEKYYFVNTCIRHEEYAQIERIITLVKKHFLFWVESSKEAAFLNLKSLFVIHDT